MRVTAKFEKRDLWVGLYWQFKAAKTHVAGCKVQDCLDVYICLVPCFPIHISIPLLTYDYRTERRESKLTAEDIDAALKQGAEGVKYMRQQLRRIHTLGARNRNLVLD